MLGKDADCHMQPRVTRVSSDRFSTLRYFVLCHNNQSMTALAVAFHFYEKAICGEIFNRPFRCGSLRVVLGRGG